MEKKYIKCTLLKSDDDVIEFIASDETKDRHGEVIPLESWDLENFKRAPRMLVNHNHYEVQAIVGKWEDARVDIGADSKGLKMRANFHDITEVARETKAMVEQGYLDTVSVGYIPHIDILTDEDGKETQVERNELVEVSLVSIPANPNATQIKTLIEAEQKEEDTEKINEFLGIKKEVAEITEKKEICEKCKENGGETTKIKDKLGETRKDTHSVTKGKSVKGRSLSRSEKQARQNVVMRHALKEAVKSISFALNSVNKK